MHKSTIVKSPNSEQLMAINHLGGKILSAGAGSGKTFVLIEHIIFKLNQIRLRTPEDQFKTILPLEISKIVLMTFTKKAAGEMSIRMMKKLDELCDVALGGELTFWNIARQNLAKFNITTISSFCHRLISQGFFNGLDPDVQILSKVEFKNKINQLFNSWFVSKKNELGQVFEANANALVGAMITIYNSPELRLMWMEPLKKTSSREEIEAFIVKLYQDLDLSHLFQEVLPGDVELKEQSKGWYVFLKSLQCLEQDVNSLNSSNIKEYINWANSTGRLPTETKSMSSGQKKSLQIAKDFVKKLREVEEDLINFIDSYDIYWLWVETYQDLFFYINKYYFTIKGYTFADLEYYTYLGLSEDTASKKTKKYYNYFIVDEFQDTSSVQYEILKKLIGENHHELFCVGDKKQAIYGFRGGELQVFSQCSELLGSQNNLSLKNNFRSFGKIINFNNAFFDLIFPLGVGFENKDKHSVLMEKQIIPIAKEQTGEIVKFKGKIQDLEDIKGIDCDAYEASALFDITKKLLAREDIESLCILYRRLKPSSYLLELLGKENLPFSAQVKVEYGEDPIINLFMRCIELSLNKSNEKKYQSTLFLLQNLIEVLGVEAISNDELIKICKLFVGDITLVGLNLSFHKFCFSLGISNSLYQDNSQLIDSICKVCKDEPVVVYDLLSSENGESYSLELMNGPRAKRVVIMSAHASKGLEFDAVCLGGIHTNGNQMGKVEPVGKLPKSFKWKKMFNQKGFFKSPMYYLENDLDREKDFSESKRLLYVACTRAVKFLGWVDLNFIKNGIEEIPLSSSSNHWIKALRMIDPEQKSFSEEVMIIDSESITKKNKLPLILKDSMGVLINSKKQRLGLFAETSVTKLAELSQCPFKFYLSTICKLEAPGASDFTIGFTEDSDSEEMEDFYSTKKRGTSIHAVLSELLLEKISESTIQNKFKSISNEDMDKIKWAFEEALKIKNGKNIISEKLIKFSFFGQMISGTPDLIFEGEAELIVWDFKTGLQDKNAEDHYWFQLMCYAYAYSKLKQFGPEKMIPLSLVYVDERKIATRVLRFDAITEILFDNWSKIESLNQVNLKHCKSCEYSSICCHAIKN